MQSISPVNRPVKDAAPYYNSLAPWYDFLAGSEKKYIRAGLELLAPQSDERILEIGFGTGYAQARIASVLDQGLSVGVDISWEMIRIARRKLSRQGLAGTSLVCNDSLPLPFADDSFQAIFTSFTLELFDTPLIPRVLEECRRVLTASGRIVIVSLSKDQPLPWAGRLYETLHNRWPRALDCRPIPVKTVLLEAGFQIHRYQEMNMWGIPVAAVKAAI